MKKRIEFDEICPICRGTGLYVGMAERNGAAVVCTNCKGTGKHRFFYEYERFTKRKHAVGIKHVYACNPGICIAEGGDFHFPDFGGQPFEAWDRGELFPKGSEMRRFVCPAWWGQCVPGGRPVKWEECAESLGRLFSQCSHFKNKTECWERFDAGKPNE